MTTDFRRVYATMIKEWPGYDDTEAVLKSRFATLGLRLNGSRVISVHPQRDCGDSRDPSSLPTWSAGRTPCPPRRTLPLSRRSRGSARDGHLRGIAAGSFTRSSHESA